ncbi:MAG: alkaline phosphatase family protein [Nocardioidaceae bacterium]
MRKAAKLATVAGALALVGSSLGAHAFAAPAPAAQHGKPPLDAVYVIMLENHSQSSVIDDPNAPFITKLAHKYAMASNYYGVTHPSMPNYVASIAGDNFGIQDDNDQNVVNLDRRNLVDQLEHHGVNWGAYMQDLPADKLARFGPENPNDATKPYALYAKKHNPFVLFSDIVHSPDRMGHIKDYTALGDDLNGKNPPKFVWITPNQCNDMHGGVYDTVADHPETPCPYGSTKDDANDAALKQKADAFVKQAVHTIRSSAAWTTHSAIVIVTDENDYTGNKDTDGWETADGCCDSPYVGANDARVPGWAGGTYGGGKIPAIIVSPQGERGTVDATPYNHYSLLTTIEDNWGMRHLGHAGDTAGGVVPMWKSFLK